MFDADDHEEDASTTLMSRLGLDEESFDKAILVVGVMTRDINVGSVARRLGLTVNEVTDKRNAIIRLMHLTNHMYDDEMVEENGALPATVSEDGVGEFSNYQWGRAVFESLEGHKTDKELAAEYGLATEGAVEYGRNFFSRIILYMSAEAIKAAPYLTPVGLFDHLANKEHFLELRCLAENYLKEDDDGAEAEESFPDDVDYLKEEDDD